MSGLELILLFIVASIAGMASVLDEAQFHRPVVACTLTGIVLGDPTTGIILGGTLEMMALGWMNVGAAMAPDAALASTVSTVLVIVGHQSIGAGIALAVPLAAAGQVLTIFVRTITVFFQHLADKYAEDANLRGIEMCHIAGLLLQALRVAIPTVAIALVAGTDVVNNALNSITRGLQVAGGFIVVVGYAMVINLMNAQKLMVYFFLGFLIAVFTDVNLIGFGAIGAICAYFHIMGLKKDIAIEEAAKTGGGSAVEGDDIDDSELM